MLVVSTDLCTKRGQQAITRQATEINDPEVELLEMKALENQALKAN